MSRSHRRSQATARVAELLGGNLAGADEVGTLPRMRFVFFDNDTRLLFATAYDGDWDAYIDDFVDEDSRLSGHHRFRLGGLARDPQPAGEGLPRRNTRSRPKAGTWPIRLTVAETRG